MIYIEISSDIGVVGSADQIYNIQKSVNSREPLTQNNQMFVTSDKGKIEIIAPTYQINLGKKF